MVGCHRLQAPLQVASLPHSAVKYSPHKLGSEEKKPIVRCLHVNFTLREIQKFYRSGTEPAEDRRVAREGS